MKVLHILADGTVKESLNGHIINQEQEEFYRVLVRIQEAQNNEKKSISK